MGLVGLKMEFLARAPIQPRHNARAAAAAAALSAGLNLQSEPNVCQDIAAPRTKKKSENLIRAATACALAKCIFFFSTVALS